MCTIEDTKHKFSNLTLKRCLTRSLVEWFSPMEKDGQKVHFVFPIYFIDSSYCLPNIDNSA